KITGSPLARPAGSAGGSGPSGLDGTRPTPGRATVHQVAVESCVCVSLTPAASHLQGLREAIVGPHRLAPPTRRFDSGWQGSFTFWVESDTVHFADSLRVPEPTGSDRGIGLQTAAPLCYKAQQMRAVAVLALVLALSLATTGGRP